MEQKPIIQPMPDIQQKSVIPSRPNEQSRLNIDDFVRIYDPATKQVFVEQRA